MTAEEIWLRGEGGAVFHMTEPISPHIRKRWEAGHLTRVNADGSTWQPDAPAAAAKRAPRRKADGDGGT